VDINKEPEGVSLSINGRQRRHSYLSYLERGHLPSQWTSTRGQRALTSLLSVGNDDIHNHRILKGEQFPSQWTSTRGQRASASLLLVGNDDIHNYRILKGEHFPSQWTSTRGQRAFASLLLVGNDDIHNYCFLKGDTFLPSGAQQGARGPWPLYYR
jgi:hypothetical protein